MKRQRNLSERRTVLYTVGLHVRERAKRETEQDAIGVGSNSESMSESSCLSCLSCSSGSVLPYSPAKVRWMVSSNRLKCRRNLPHTWSQHDKRAL